MLQSYRLSEFPFEPNPNLDIISGFVAKLDAWAAHQAAWVQQYERALEAVDRHGDTDLIVELILDDRREIAFDHAVRESFDLQHLTSEEMEELYADHTIDMLVGHVTKDEFISEYRMRTFCDPSLVIA
jgi:hypothetical protein